MTIPAFLLILTSAFIHAGWNILGKRSGSSLPFFVAAVALGTLLASPILLLYSRVLSTFTPGVWAYLILTGAFQAFYYLALGAAYQSGEISLTYPLARSLPVLLVAIFNLLVGAVFGWVALSGMLLVCVGGLVLPQPRLSEWRLNAYLNWPTLWALAAALCTAGYSLVDDAALRLARQSSTAAIPAHELALVYAVLEGFSIMVWLACLLGFSRRGRQSLRASLRQPTRPVLLAGVGMTTAYILVLLAMGLAANVSYIVAFRQIGILFGALAGVAFLGEARRPAKLLGVSLMVTGLILVGIG
jgi:drug/metabolite transporter (DMT)-like permease